MFRQQRWMVLLNHYDITIEYNPGKANVVAYVGVEKRKVWVPYLTSL